MPPKQAKAKPGAPGAGSTAAVEEDISDVGSLPPLNEFIFMNLYAFKYKKNRHDLEKVLLFLLRLTWLINFSNQHYITIVQVVVFIV